MARQLTEFIPDTCPCVFVLEWDDEQAEAEREHFAHVIRPCSFHDSSPETAYETAMEENNRKNLFLKQVFDNFPELHEVDGKGGRALKEGTVTYEFNEKRELVVDIPEITKEQADSLMEAVVADPSIDDTKIAVNEIREVKEVDVILEPADPADPVIKDAEPDTKGEVVTE